MEVKNNKKQEIIITLSDSEASTLKAILLDSQYRIDELLENEKLRDCIEKPAYRLFKQRWLNERDMADKLYDEIHIAQGFEIVR